VGIISVILTMRDTGFNTNYAHVPLAGPSGSQPMTNPFGDPHLMHKLEANPATQDFMKDPGFRDIMQKIQKDPKCLGFVMQCHLIT